MMNKKLNNNSLYKIYRHTLVSLPVPSNIYIYWNFGSMLAICLMIQIISGLLLAAMYMPSMNDSFMLVIKFMETVNQVWFLRYIHANGASLFFIMMYMHIGRGLFFHSFLLEKTWMIGVSILFLTMAAAFMGYVLPLNQMSFWGASVITNLATEIPYLGKHLIKFIWGSPSVDQPTVNRFFMFHFILPFIILAFVMLHITMLHTTGSSNPMGMTSKKMKMKFGNNFSLNDMMTVALFITMFIMLCMLKPLLLGDDENFITANPASTPKHIQPEWYFLLAYSILRSIPNKLGGVIALVMSIAILYITPFTQISKNKNMSYYPINKIIFWFFVLNAMLLTWIGAQSIEQPFIFMGQAGAIFYFSYFILHPVMMKSWDYMMNK